MTTLANGGHQDGAMEDATGGGGDDRASLILVTWLEAADTRELDEFCEAILIYQRTVKETAVKEVSYEQLERSIRTNDLGIYIIAMERQRFMSIWSGTSFVNHSPISCQVGPPPHLLSTATSLAQASQAVNDIWVTFKNPFCLAILKRTTECYDQAKSLTEQRGLDNHSTTTLSAQSFEHFAACIVANAKAALYVYDFIIRDPSLFRHQFNYQTI
ncbi:MAG: hypothetical protein Q9168_004149, partial [Polycauliona sp. 1 TL-2023]